MYVCIVCDSHSVCLRALKKVRSYSTIKTNLNMKNQWWPHLLTKDQCNDVSLFICSPILLFATQYHPEPCFACLSSIYMWLMLIRIYIFFELTWLRIDAVFEIESLFVVRAIAVEPDKDFGAIVEINGMDKFTKSVFVRGAVVEAAHLEYYHSIICSLVHFI